MFVTFILIHVLYTNLYSHEAHNQVKPFNCGLYPVLCALFDRSRCYSANTIAISFESPPGFLLCLLMKHDFTPSLPCILWCRDYSYCCG